MNLRNENSLFEGVSIFLFRLRLFLQHNLFLGGGTGIGKAISEELLVLGARKISISKIHYLKLTTGIQFYVEYFQYSFYCHDVAKRNNNSNPANDINTLFIFLETDSDLQHLSSSVKVFTFILDNLCDIS